MSFVIQNKLFKRIKKTQKKRKGKMEIKNTI